MPYFENVDNGTVAKFGFLLGVGLLAIGTGGEFVGHAFWGELPAWENTLFFASAIIGLLSAVSAPAIFGVVLPLIE